MIMNKEDLYKHLKEVFNYQSKHQYMGVYGVYIIDSGKPGPTVGLTAMTHGNEPCGLHVLDYLVKKESKGWKPKVGKIVLVINNIEAARNYFDHDDPDNSSQFRYLDRNMNRLPEDLEISHDDQREVVRAKVLKPIWESFDCAIDFHSCTGELKPMAIMGYIPSEKSTAFQLPFDTYVDNIVPVQIGVPAFGHYGKNPFLTDVFEIEGGPHMSYDYMDFLTRAVQRYLNILGLDDDPVDIEGPQAADIYHMHGTLIVPEAGYEVARIFQNYEFLPQGTVLATKGDKEIKIDFDGCPFLPPTTTKINDHTEEALFLSKPVKKVIKTPELQ